MFINRIEQAYIEHQLLSLRVPRLVVVVVVVVGVGVGVGVGVVVVVVAVVLEHACALVVFLFWSCCAAPRRGATVVVGVLGATVVVAVVVEAAQVAAVVATARAVVAALQLCMRPSQKPCALILKCRRAERAAPP